MTSYQASPVKVSAGALTVGCFGWICISLLLCVSEPSVWDRQREAVRVDRARIRSASDARVEAVDRRDILGAKSKGAHGDSFGWYSGSGRCGTDERLDRPALVHRGVGSGDAIEVRFEVEDSTGVDPPTEDVLEKFGQVRS